GRNFILVLTSESLIHKGIFERRALREWFVSGFNRFHCPFKLTSFVTNEYLAGALRLKGDDHRFNWAPHGCAVKIFYHADDLSFAWRNEVLSYRIGQVHAQRGCFAYDIVVGISREVLGKVPTVKECEIQ